MQDNYSLHPHLILRTPSLSFDRNLNENEIFNNLSNDQFKEAIFLASPDLYAKLSTLEKNNNLSSKDRKVLLSLVNYLSRMKSRCTPFGLFAGCSLISWGDDTNIYLNTTTSRHSRLDMHFLGSLSQLLANLDFIKEKLRYFPNSSYHEFGNQIRYIEYRYENGKRIHQTSAVEALPLLMDILKISNNGVTIKKLIHFLSEKGINENEAIEFIDQLIASQLLTSELEPSVTGKEILTQLLDKLSGLAHYNKNVQIRKVANYLKLVKDELAVLDSNKVNKPESYNKLINLLETLDVPIEKNKLFQVDLVQSIEQATLSSDTGESLLEAVEVLKKLNVPYVNSNLQEFIKRYRERYEEVEKPLLEILDPEAGLGYAGLGNNGYAPFIEDLVLPSSETKTISIKRNPAQALLYSKIQEALLSKKKPNKY